MNYPQGRLDSHFTGLADAVHMCYNCRDRWNTAMIRPSASRHPDGGEMGYKSVTTIHITSPDWSKVVPQDEREAQEIETRRRHDKRKCWEGVDPFGRSHLRQSLDPNTA